MLVYLGDLIDPTKHVSGYNAARVLDLVTIGIGRSGLQETVLMGNHDQFFTIALVAAQANTPLPYEPGTWIDQGGRETAEAWDISGSDERLLAQALWKQMSASQRSVFERMQVYHEHEGYLLVHAGFPDDIPLAPQLAKEWKSEFPHDRMSEHDHPFWRRMHDEDVAPKGHVLIAGHTPRRRAFLGKRHIGIDTGVKQGGPLTAIEIVGDRLRLHQAWPPGLERDQWER
jgi:serine/threonine protein phosphatase 1